MTLKVLLLYTSIDQRYQNLLMREILPTYPSKFRAEILSYTNWSDAQKSLLGRLLLKNAMKLINEPFREEDVVYNDFGKPIFKDNNVEFNISHSGEIVVCAITRNCSIGVDIEKIRNVNISIFKAQMTKQELSSIAAAEEKLVAFFDYWTKKEAVVKAHGKGLSIPLKKFEVVNNRTKLEHTQYFTKEIHLHESYKAHLAVNCGIGELSVEIIKVSLDENGKFLKDK